MHHRTIRTNHQPDATVFQFIILTFVYSSTCFRRFPAHYQELNDCSGSLWFYLRIVVTAVLCSWSDRPAGRPDHEHSIFCTRLFRGKMHSDCSTKWRYFKIDGSMEKKWDTIIPGDLKRLFVSGTYMSRWSRKG